MRPLPIYSKNEQYPTNKVATEKAKSHTNIIVQPQP